MSENESMLHNKIPPPPRRLILPSLAIARFATQPPFILTTLFLIEIGQAFERSIGATAQIQTVALMVGAITALFMGVLSQRFHHKTLLLTGLVFLCISAIWCAFTFNFIIFNVAYAIGEIGIAMIAPMVVTLIADHFPHEKRVNAVGWVSAGLALAYIFGTPAIIIISNLEFGGWRFLFLGFVLPISLISFVIAIKGIPSPITQNIHQKKKPSQYVDGFTEVLNNRSAIASLVGVALILAASQSVGVYGATFYREQFQVSTEFASITIMGSAIMYVLGAGVIGQYVKQSKTKPLTVLSSVFGGFCVIVYANVNILWLSMSFMLLGSLCFGMIVTSSTSLILEQIPKFRGTMMSIHSTAWYLGMALGTGIGGVTLLLFDYRVLGLVLGIFGLIAAFLFHFLVKIPKAFEISNTK